MGKIANRQSLAILDRGLKSQPSSQFCCIGMFKTNRQSRVSNRSFKSQGRDRFESRVFKSLAILDLDRAILPILEGGKKEKGRVKTGQITAMHDFQAERPPVQRCFQRSITILAEIITK